MQPIQPFLGGGFFYENGGQVINIDDNGVSSNLQPCPTTTTSTTSTTTTAAPVEYTIDNGANGSAFGACTGSVPTSQVFAAPGNTVPIVTLILYTNQNLTSPFVGSAGWRKLVQGVTSYAAEVDANGEITNYVTCASQTTTTTTSTTTTTTTSSGVSVSGANSFFAGEIVDILVNGVTIDGVTFPVNIGDGFSGTTSFSGTQTIQVFVENVAPNGCITISADTFNDTAGSGDFSASLTTNINGGVTINGNDGACV